MRLLAVESWFGFIFAGIAKVLKRLNCKVLKPVICGLETQNDPFRIAAAAYRARLYLNGLTPGIKYARGMASATSLKTRLTYLLGLPEFKNKASQARQR